MCLLLFIIKGVGIMKKRRLLLALLFVSPLLITPAIILLEPMYGVDMIDGWVERTTDTRYA